MGNFYTNIVIVEPRADPVIAALERAGRNAFVANDGRVTIIYDERCDDQDLHELERLAAALASELGLPTLAVCNHDDDVLWYALADEYGVDRYNSWPGYFDEGGDTPEGGDARRLCMAFGVRDREEDVAALLEEPHDRIGMEIDRHAQLAELLGIPADAALLGYRYVSRGELAIHEGSALTLRAVGGTERSQSGESEGGKAMPLPPAQAPSLGASPAEAQDAVMLMAALAFTSVDVPDRFAASRTSSRWPERGSISEAFDGRDQAGPGRRTQRPNLRRSVAPGAVVVHDSRPELMRSAQRRYHKRRLAGAAHQRQHGYCRRLGLDAQLLP